VVEVALDPQVYPPATRGRNDECGQSNSSILTAVIPSLYALDGTTIQATNEPQSKGGSNNYVDEQPVSVYQPSSEKRCMPPQDRHPVHDRQEAELRLTVQATAARRGQ